MKVKSDQRSKCSNLSNQKEEHFIEKLNAQRFFKNILKNSKNGRRFGVSLCHYQVKTVKGQSRIYKT